MHTLFEEHEQALCAVLRVRGEPKKDQICTLTYFTPTYPYMLSNGVLQVMPLEKKNMHEHFFSTD